MAGEDQDAKRPCIHLGHLPCRLPQKTYCSSTAKSSPSWPYSALSFAADLDAAISLVQVHSIWRVWRFFGEFIFSDLKNADHSLPDDQRLNSRRVIGRRQHFEWNCRHYATRWI